MKSFRHFLILLILVILAGLWLCNGPEEKAEAPQSPQQEEVPQPVEKEEKIKKKKPKKPVDQPTTWENTAGLSVKCKGKKLNLVPAIREITDEMTTQQIPYDASKLADCSGIFHQFLQKLKTVCPEQSYPKVASYRDTRGLARWYHEQGALTLITDPKSQSDLIKPGAVLFFGYGGKSYEQVTAQDLFQRGTGINHVGIVTEVEKNAQGQIINYKLFHGRNPKYPAGITPYHRLEPSRSGNPPLGNGSQPWVAFAPVVKINN